jgi:hypothetical protein
MFRLPPGKYELLVLIDVLPYFDTEGIISAVASSLNDYFDNPQFCKAQARIGRVAVKRNIEVFTNDSQEVSINLK